MRYAIIESGGKQYRAVEGELLEVDRLPEDEGKQIGLEHILLMADGTDFMIGTPIVSGIEVRATVVDHISGRKVTHFRYSPKKRIRVRGGHRQQYTRLMVDFIGAKGEVRKVSKPEAEDRKPEADAKKATAKAAPGPSKAAAKKPSEKKPAARKTTVPGKTAGKKSS